MARRPRLEVVAQVRHKERLYVSHVDIFKALQPLDNGRQVAEHSNSTMELVILYAEPIAPTNIVVQYHPMVYGLPQQAAT